MKRSSALGKADCNIQITLEECRKIQLEMLNAVVQICEENGLRYFLCGGTLLGAIRHKGFIPWDDDIDIEMPRPDYERLMQLSGGKIGRFRLAGPDRGEYMDCCRWFRLYDDNTVVENFRGHLDKIKPYYHPIFIDIFPLEGLPTGKISSYINWGRHIFLSKMQRSASLDVMVGRNFAAHAFHVLSAIPAKAVGYNRWGRAIERLSKKYSFDKCEYIGVTTVEHYITREKVLKKPYIKEIKVLFEGKYYTAPGGYDIYLTQLYGDYMKLPPVEKRCSHHAFKFYLINAEAYFAADE